MIKIVVGGIVFTLPREYIMSRDSILREQDMKVDKEYARHVSRCSTVGAAPMTRIKFVLLSRELHDQNLVDAYVKQEEFNRRGVRK